MSLSFDDRATCFFMIHSPAHMLISFLHLIGLLATIALYFPLGILLFAFFIILRRYFPPFYCARRHQYVSYLSLQPHQTSHPLHSYFSFKRISLPTKSKWFLRMDLSNTPLHRTWHGRHTWSWRCHGPSCRENVSRTRRLHVPLLLVGHRASQCCRASLLDRVWSRNSSADIVWQGSNKDKPSRTYSNNCTCIDTCDNCLVKNPLHTSGLAIITMCTNDELLKYECLFYFLIANIDPNRGKDSLLLIAHTIGVRQEFFPPKRVLTIP